MCNVPESYSINMHGNCDLFNLCEEDILPFSTNDPFSSHMI